MNAVHAPPEAAPDPPPGVPEDAVPQTRTLLLTDLTDSTGLVERIGDVAAADLFRAHDRLVLDLQRRWRGRLIDRSDGLLLLFERAVDGLGFALDYQDGLRELGRARNLDLKARAGLHVGEVLTWRNSPEAVAVGAKPLEVEGLAKPLAGRLLGLARPGQILLSATAEALARRAARELGPRGEQLAWKSHGRWRLKGVPEPLEIYEAGTPAHAPLRAPQPDAKAWRDVPIWRRPAALAAQVVLASMLGIAFWFFTRPQPAIAFAERDWVVVADMRNLTGQPVLDDSLQQAFRISLEQSRHVNVLSDLKAHDTLARMQRGAGTDLDREVASEIAVRDGARAVILPTVAEVGGRVRVSAEVIDPHSQTTVYAEFADGEGLDSVLASVDDVTAALRARLGEEIKAIERDTEPLPEVTTSNLDALRAYALGQEQYRKSEYQEARKFYEHATDLDPSFALAFVGQLRAHNAMSDLRSGVEYLEKAYALRARLPPRERLYVEAWMAEVNEPPAAMDVWKRLASLYPDYHQASANVGYALHARNRFSEGISFATQAASPRSEFAPLSWDLIGRLALGTERYGEAEEAFEKAIAMGALASSIRLADAHAARRRFPEAEKAWSQAGEVSGVPFNLVSIYLDQGRLEEARTEAERLASRVTPGSRRARTARFPLAVVKWLSGEEEDALADLNVIVREAIAAVGAARSTAEAMDDAYLAIVAGVLAQRMGDTRLAQKVSQELEKHAGLSDAPSNASMFAVFQAHMLRLSGKEDEAAAFLRTRIKGDEAFQAHAALQSIYADSGKSELALAEARWMTRHRGRAYSELGCGWCQQALNVADTTLGHLEAAELLASLGKEQEAKMELKAFDRQWRTANLPGYLRVRREVLVDTFN